MVLGTTVGWNTAPSDYFIVTDPIASGDLESSFVVPIVACKQDLSIQQSSLAFGVSKAKSVNKLKSVIIGSSVRYDPPDPLVIVLPSLLKKVFNFTPISLSSSFLSFLTLDDINHDTLVPAYFHDNHLLIHLAFILYPQLGDQAPKIALDYVDVEEEDTTDNERTMNVDHYEGGTEEDVIVPVQTETNDADLDVEILDAPPAIFKTLSNKSLKVKEKPDDSFLRHSKRISNKL